MIAELLNEGSTRKNRDAIAAQARRARRRGDIRRQN